MNNAPQFITQKDGRVVVVHSVWLLARTWSGSTAARTARREWHVAAPCLVALCQDARSVPHPRRSNLNSPRFHKRIEISVQGPIPYRMGGSNCDLLSSGFQ